MDYLIDPIKDDDIDIDVGEGIVNPVYGLRDDPVGYEVAAPDFLPSEDEDATADSDTYANHPPQYINNNQQHSSSSRQLNYNDVIASSSSSASHQPLQQHGNGSRNLNNHGRQLQQNNHDLEVGMSYSSCNNNTPPLSKEILRTNHNIAAVQQQNHLPHPIGIGEYEREGYVQPTEVFNPATNGEKSNAVVNDSSSSSPHGNHAARGTERKEIRVLVESNTGGGSELQHDDNGYLSPTDAPGDEDIVTTLATLAACENPYTGTPKAIRREYNRFDSGVVDCDPGKESPTSPPTDSITPFRHRLSTSVEEHYEDIDVYRNELMAMTSSKKGPSKKTAGKEKSDSMKVRILPPQRSQRPSVDIQQTHPIQSNSESVSGRQNPKTTQVRSQIASSCSSNPYTHIDPANALDDPDRNKHKQRNGKQWCIISSILVALFVLVTVSLAISLSILILDAKREDKNVVIETVQIPSLRENSSDPMFQPQRPLTLDDRQMLFQLQSQIHSLEEKNTALDTVIQKQKNETEAKLNDLMGRQTSMTSNMDSLSTHVQAQIANISSSLQDKGVDSLSSCRLQSNTSTTLKPTGIHVETNFHPNDEELKNNFVLFAFCTFIGMEDVNLDVQKTGTSVQYRCRCKATKKGLSYKSCTLYYWLCPR